MSCFWSEQIANMLTKAVPLEASKFKNIDPPASGKGRGWNAVILNYILLYSCLFNFFILSYV